MEIPSVLYIVTIFVTFTYDYCIVNDYKMTAR
jgi:hypothetical protein